MGLHAADIIRRDAAEQHIWFTSERMDNQDFMLVTVLYEGQDSDLDLMYTIDMENDIIKDIKFSELDGPKGSLTFTYLQDIGGMGNEFTEPMVSVVPEASPRPSPGILWLIHLVHGQHLDDRS
jgi:hypothetical protein